MSRLLYNTLMNRFAYSTEFELDLTGKTLIVPVVSVANVSQLAADLLIASLSLHRIAIINAKFFVPVVGGREGGDGITTPLELYGKANGDLVIMQQRSPVLKSRKQEFVVALLDFIKSSSLGSVLFISGVDLSNRTDAQMFTSTYHIHPPNSPPLTTTALRALTSIPPYYTFAPLASPHDGVKDTAIPFIPGGGLTRRILSSLPSQWPVPTASMLQFVLEGDNRTDARQFAAAVAKVVGLKSLEHWTQPSSWQGLFGAPHDQALYG